MSHIVLRRPAARIVAAACLAGFAGITCLNPTDRSSEVYVTLGAIDPLLRSDSLVLQGTQAMLVAHAWQRLPPRDSVEIPNVEFRWSSRDSVIATVHGQGGGAARLTGIAAGRTTVTVAAIPFQSSNPATFPLRVSSPFTLDSVRADTASYSPYAGFYSDPTHHTVKYGQLLTFYGVGTRGIFFATLGGTPLIADTFSFKGLPQGLGQMAFWVPRPAQTGTAVALALGGNVFDTTVIQVRHRDIYKVKVPRDTAPSAVSLDAPGPIPQYPGLLFYNPALAYEDLARGDSVGADWFRFTRADTAAPITLIVTTPDLANLSRVQLSDSIVYMAGTASHSIGASAWTIGPREYDCRGRRFLPAQAAPDSIIIALRTLPRGLHLLSRYAVPGNYLLAVVNGYVHDAKMVPDRFTGNNTCTMADLNFAVPALTMSIASGPGFRDSTLTLDNPQAVDWYRFHVTSALLQSVQIQTRPLPFTAGLDSSAIDFYVLTTDTLGVLGKAIATVPGARDSLTLGLATGDYYLVVVDFAGVPTRYALCIVQSTFPHCDPATTGPVAPLTPTGILTTATPPPLGPAPRSRAAPRRSSARRAPWQR
jgi:hypothetical protein